jgi:hypothetical protein
MSGSITRRGVLSGAAVLAGVTALPPFLAPASGARSAVGHVVVDDRLAHSAAFADGFFGANIHRVNALDDLCNRWYTRLRREVLADARHIAGLTSWIDYVVMQSCAAEIGYRSAPAAVFASAPTATASDHVRMVTWVFAPRN